MWRSTIRYSLSPGPGIPDEAGIMKQVIEKYGPTKSILGICLGHQGIAEVYGAKLFNIPKVLHGVTSVARVIDRSEIIFTDVSEHFSVHTLSLRGQWFLKASQGGDAI